MNKTKRKILYLIKYILEYKSVIASKIVNLYNKSGKEMRDDYVRKYYVEIHE